MSLVYSGSIWSRFTYTFFALSATVGILYWKTIGAPRRFLIEVMRLIGQREALIFVFRLERVLDLYSYGAVPHLFTIWLVFNLNIVDS